MMPVVVPVMMPMMMAVVMPVMRFLGQQVGRRRDQGDCGKQGSQDYFFHRINADHGSGPPRVHYMPPSSAM